MSQILKSVASRQGLQHHPPDLPGSELRGSFERLRVFPSVMQDHWRAGYHDAVRTLRHPEVLARPASLDGVFTFDLERDGRE